MEIEDIDQNGFSWNIDVEGEDVVEIEPENEAVAEKTNDEEKPHKEEGTPTPVPIEIPRYKRDFSAVLKEKEFWIETGKEVKEDTFTTKICFNCLGDHSMSDCPEPRNPQAVAENKKAILGPKKSGTVRYHMDVETKLGHIKPGTISDKLSEALGLKKGDAPEFIYRMRVMGYPPGWLKEAEVTGSDMSIFDAQGKAMNERDNEEGEVDTQTKKYDPEKLISFPGFNVPFSRGVRDRCHELNFPPMQRHHSRQNFLDFMNRNKATKYKRRKLRLEDTPNSTSEHDSSVGDMDLENASMPEQSCPPHPSTVAPSDSPAKEDGEISEHSNDSPKREEDEQLEVVPLSEQCVNILPQENSSSTIGEDTSDAPQSRSSLEPRESDLDNSNSTISEHLPSKSYKKHHRSNSKGFTLGTFLPSSITPFSTLPDYSKWTVDVSDHILFDNLPDALGTWKKMHGIVSNIRGKMTELHKEDSDGD